MASRGGVPVRRLPRPATEVSPQPQSVDDWTLYLHDADGWLYRLEFVDRGQRLERSLPEMRQRSRPRTVLIAIAGCMARCTSAMSVRNWSCRRCAAILQKVMRAA